VYEHHNRDVRPQWGEERDRVDLIDDDVVLAGKVRSITAERVPMNSRLTATPDKSNAIEILLVTCTLEAGAEPLN
jgi:hypothetical protein